MVATKVYSPVDAFALTQCRRVLVKAHLLAVVQVLPWRGLRPARQLLSSCNWGASARSFSGKVIRKKVSNQVKNPFVDNFMVEKHKIYSPMFAKQNVDYNEAIQLCFTK